VRSVSQAQFEFKLKARFQRLLKSKRGKWDSLRNEIAQKLRDLSNFFTGARLVAHAAQLFWFQHHAWFSFPGEVSLIRVERDEHIMTWFAGLSVKVEGLDYDRPMLAGRTIQALMRALEQCESFEAIATRSVPVLSLVVQLSMTLCTRVCQSTCQIILVDRAGAVHKHDPCCQR
jgi:hypothetical protein